MMRGDVRIALPTALLLSLCCSASAQPALDRLLIVAPAAPGGGWDQTARAMQHVLEADGVVRITEVQNIAGAAGTVGLAQFVDVHQGNGRALLVSGLVMLGATLWNESPVSLDQATPIAQLTGEYEVIAVPAASPHKDLRSLVDELRRRPSGVSWGGGSAGGTDHILVGLIAEAVSVDPRRVNYIAFSGGGEAVSALLGGNVSAGVSGYAEFAPHIDSGRLRALAISAPARVEGIDVPTLRDQGVDVELINWRAVMAPPGLSDPDRARLADTVRTLVRSPRWKQVLQERGWTDMFLEGDAFAALLRTERDKLTRIVGRLRGPAAPTRVTAGRWIFPAAILTGSVTIVLAMIVSWRRRRGTRPSEPLTADRSALVWMALGLLVFVVVIEPLGFIAAGSALFACAAIACGAGAARAVCIGVILCAAIYAGFTRGLDMPLPSGAAWAWMR
jgi:putative tricarboxylic transport membrane protein